MNAKLERLRETVEGLGNILESYQTDLRSRGLDREGFCQGVIYREDAPRLIAEALQLIEWIESEMEGDRIERDLST